MYKINVYQKNKKKFIDIYTAKPGTMGIICDNDVHENYMGKVVMKAFEMIVLLENPMTTWSCSGKKNEFLVEELDDGDIITITYQREVAK